MDILEYTEKTADETLAYLRESYDELHERLQKLVTALIGGAGAVAAFAMTQYHQPEMRLLAITIGSLAAVWFVIAIVAMVGGRSRELSPGNGPGNVLKYYDQRLGEQVGKPDLEAREIALETTRRAELELQQRRLREYSSACTRRAKILDRAYMAVSIFSPMAPLVVYITGLHFR